MWGNFGIQMKGVYDRHIHPPKTKNSDVLNMPLTIKALEFLDLIQHDEPKLIPQKGMILDSIVDNQPL